LDRSPAGFGQLGIGSDSNQAYINGGGGVVLQDSAPVGFGTVQIESFSNDVNITSANDVNITAAYYGGGNIKLTTHSNATGIVISNIDTGGVGTLTVDAGNHLYWNGTFIA